MLKTLYVDTDLTFLKDQDLAAGGSADKGDSTYDGRNGVRCIRISPDGKHLASGDRAGNIRIHDMQFMDQLYKIEAHDAEVLSLEYSRPESGLRLLASASRDRLIHIFSVDQVRAKSFFVLTSRTKRSYLDMHWFDRATALFRRWMTTLRPSRRSGSY